MYLNILFIHSWLRWIIIIFLCIVLFRAFSGFTKKTPYTKFDNISSVILLASTHLQVLLGFWLYFFLSPLTDTPTQNFMKNPILRYWKLEHFFMMIVFLVLVQVGRIMTKKSTSNVGKHKKTLLFSFFAFAVLAFSIPWPNTPYGRPLFREMPNLVDKQLER